jgi:hypothetical protein
LKEKEEEKKKEGAILTRIKNITWARISKKCICNDNYPLQ